LEPSGPVIRL